MTRSNNRASGATGTAPPTSATAAAAAVFAAAKASTLDEARLLREALARVAHQSLRMQRQWKGGQYAEAVVAACDVAAELRVPVGVGSPSSTAEDTTAPARSGRLLSPRSYYDLYLAVLQALRVLETSLWSLLQSQPLSVLPFYEHAQHSPYVVARLYPLITVGSVYVRSRQAPAEDVLRDLLEMCAGVQHPERGLFLRAYLLQAMKDKLPDEGGEYAGSAQGSIAFLLRNFTEMNRLWVRMQRDCPAGERARREHERRQLQSLVGANVACLARLQALTVEMYRDTVLPQLTEQVLECQDVLAQECLMDCIVQAFPDALHVATLPHLLQTCAALRVGVDVRSVLTGLADRLGRFARADAAHHTLLREADALQTLLQWVPQVLDSQRAASALSDELQLYRALLGFLLVAFPEQRQHCDALLGLCAKAVSQRLPPPAPPPTSVDETEDVSPPAPTTTSELPPTRPDTPMSATRRRRPSGDGQAAAATPAPAADTDDPDVVPLLERILLLPLHHYTELEALASLAAYPTVMQLLPLENQRALAAEVLRRSLPPGSTGRGVAALPLLEALLGLVRPLLEQMPGEEVMYHRRTGVPYLAVDGELVRGYEAQQHLVAQIVYLLRTDDLRLFVRLRQALLSGGPARTRLTLPPLAFALLRLLRVYRARHGPAACDKLLEFVHQVLSDLADVDASTALRMHLQGAAAVDASELSDDRFLYEFMAHAYVLFEEEIADSRSQFSSLVLIVGTLGTLHRLDADNYESLASKAVKHASRLLTRADQCLALCACSTLFSDVGGGRWEASRALGCLERAARAARSSVAPAERALLLLDVLNRAMLILEELHERAPDTARDAAPNDVWDDFCRFTADTVDSVRDLLTRLEPDASGGKAAAARLARALAYLRDVRELHEGVFLRLHGGAA
ncbi:hypothetical protein CDCA_CDCA12G3546 [Cyanidium caldarium]|uniref:Vacuolar protein sorting-associated protein 35 n=1 Tax=Cyanidium caldarium TaxID=2771 RepID=A0AAV9IZQ2_CYACA|nr:hypothetical protein CDCA_CDCA12G3546 [Cyanidium caldarium]